MLRTRSLGQRDSANGRAWSPVGFVLSCFGMLWMGCLCGALARGGGRRERGSASAYARAYAAALDRSWG